MLNFSKSVQIKKKNLILNDLRAGVSKLSPGGLISAGQWPSRSRIGHPWPKISVLGEQFL